MEMVLVFQMGQSFGLQSDSGHPGGHFGQPIGNTWVSLKGASVCVCVCFAAAAAAVAAVTNYKLLCNILYFSASLPFVVYCKIFSYKAMFIFV